MPSDWVQRPEWAFSPCGSCSLCMWGLGHIGSLDPADRAFSRLLVRETEGGGGGEGGLRPTRREVQSSVGIGDGGCDPQWWGTVLRIAAIVMCCRERRMSG
jgi:hypothetical protein